MGGDAVIYLVLFFACSFICGLKKVVLLTSVWHNPMCLVASPVEQQLQLALAQTK
jgi:hypothetical protein